MTTHLQALLRSKADRTLFSGQGDDERDGKFYLLNGFDCLLDSMADALVKDGIDRETIMGLFVSHAQEVLDKGTKNRVPEARKRVDLVIQRALRLWAHRQVLWQSMPTFPEREPFGSRNKPVCHTPDPWRVVDDAKNSRIEPHAEMAEPVAGG